MADSHNLTRDEAARRSRLLRVESYDIDLDLSEALTAATFRCVTTVRFDCAEPGAASFIEVAAARLDRAELNGVALDVAGFNAADGLALPDLAERNVLVVEARMAYSTAGRGLTRVIDGTDGRCYLHTQFEPADAQGVFACFDQPDLKATFTWQVSAPAHWALVSNMPVEKSTVDEKLATVRFLPSPRMSTYINALCAGDFVAVRAHHDGIELGVYTTAALAPYVDAADIFEVTRSCFDYFHAEFDYRYPLTKYDQVFAPGFGTGAMENLGCVVFAEQLFIHRSAVTEVEQLVRAAVIAHEMAHMWFGDLVTMRWWDDLWLNEAFATWAAFDAVTSATRFTDAWTAFLDSKGAAYRADQLSSTHPVCSDAPDVITSLNNADAITYRKGASVLKQLVAYVGEDAFREGLRAYFRIHAYANTTFDDLLDCLSEAAGRPLAEFAQQWLHTCQVNTLRPRLSLDDEGRYVEAEIHQEAPPEHPHLRRHSLAIGLYDRAGGALVRRDQVRVEVAGAVTGVADLVGLRAADLVLINDDDLTYAKVRLDQRSMATVLAHLGDIQPALPRALCHAAALDMLRDGELAARDYVSMACTSLATETDVKLIASMMTHARTALEQYADPAWAPTGWGLVAAGARAALAAAAGGSGVQVAWARAFVDAAGEPEHLRTLAGWLAGKDIPEGLVIGPELRWRIVSALAAHGEIGAEDIDAELAADHTGDGALRAATAHTLRPDPRAKAQAWAELCAEEPPPILRQRSLTAGMFHRTQLELTAEYRDAFFAGLDRIWRHRVAPAAIEFVHTCYPYLHVDARTEAAAAEWLRGVDRDPVAVRLVADHLDQTRRAIQARTVDMAADPAVGRTGPIGGDKVPAYQETVRSTT